MSFSNRCDFHIEQINESIELLNENFGSVQVVSVHSKIPRIIKKNYLSLYKNASTNSIIRINLWFQMWNERRQLVERESEIDEMVNDCYGHFFLVLLFFFYNVTLIVKLTSN